MLWSFYIYTYNTFIFYWYWLNYTDYSITCIDYPYLFLSVAVSICEFYLYFINTEFYDRKLSIFYELSAICWIKILFSDYSLCSNRVEMGFYSYGRYVFPIFFILSFDSISVSFVFSLSYFSINFDIFSYNYWIYYK